MSARQIVRTATAIALDNTLSPPQMPGLQRHLAAGRSRAAGGPNSDPQGIAEPRDPAIAASVDRLVRAHQALYGESAVSRDSRRSGKRRAAGLDMGG
jgi:hypothetical protein